MMIIGPENEAPDEWTSAHKYWNFVWQRDYFRAVAWRRSSAGAALSGFCTITYLSRTLFFLAAETILSVWKVLLALKESSRG